MHLGDLIHPTPVRDFLQTTLGVEPALFHGDQDRFGTLFSWDILSDVISRVSPDSSQIRLNQDARNIAESEWISTHISTDGRVFRTLRTPQLLELLHKGATLVVDAVDRTHRPLGSLARTLERDLRTPVQINAYSAWGESPGFGMHWDGHDVLILQIAGQKEWTLFGGPRRPWPMEQDIEENPAPSSEAEQTVMVLAPGDVLHVPRGWWHSARAMDGPTLHLTVGIPRPTGVDLLQWLAGRMSAHPVLRMDLPRYHPPDVQERHRQDIVRTVSSLLEDPALLETFLTEQDACAPARRYQSLGVIRTGGTTLGGAETVSWLAPRAVLREEDDRVVVEADGRRFTFASAASAMVKLLMEQMDCTVGEVLAVGTGGTTPLGEDDVRAFLTDVVEAGLVAVSGLG